MLFVFALNLLSAIFEFTGGLLTGSVAILSDAMHDLGDAASVGVAYYLEKKSRRAPDDRHTYGYLRYSVLGAAVTDTVLIAGSVTVIFFALSRLFDPEPIHGGGMVFFAIFGLGANLTAAYLTRGGESLNQKAVHLHMAEDVLGWTAVLVGAAVYCLTGFAAVDALLSIGVALFIMWGAVQSFRRILPLFLDKTPEGLSVESVKKAVEAVEGVEEVHHLHLRSFDGTVSCATLHIVTCRSDLYELKSEVRQVLADLGIAHATLETEAKDEPCGEP